MFKDIELGNGDKIKLLIPPLGYLKNGNKNRVVPPVHFPHFHLPTVNQVLKILNRKFWK